MNEKISNDPRFSHVLNYKLSQREKATNRPVWWKYLISFLIGVLLTLVIVNLSYSSTWEPEIIIEIESVLVNGEWQSISHLKSEHFRWQFRPELEFQFLRLIAAEKLLHSIKEATPVASPEPSTVLLLASGLGVLIMRRRKNSY